MQDETPIVELVESARDLKMEWRIGMNAASIVLTIIVVPISIWLSVLFVTLPGNFVPIFKDFDTELPAVTKLMINVPWWMWLGIGIGCAAICVLKEKYVYSARRRVAIGSAMLFGCALAYIFLVEALSLPVLKLIQHVTNG